MYSTKKYYHSVKARFFFYLPKALFSYLISCSTQCRLRCRTVPLDYFTCSIFPFFWISKILKYSHAYPLLLSFLRNSIAPIIRISIRPNEHMSSTSTRHSLLIYAAVFVVFFHVIRSRLCDISRLLALEDFFYISPFGNVCLPSKVGEQLRALSSFSCIFFWQRHYGFFFLCYWIIVRQLRRVFFLIVYICVPYVILIIILI